MAKKGSARKPKRKSARRRGGNAADLTARAIRAALDLAAETDFRAVALAAVAERAGVGEDALRHRFPTRRDLVKAILGAVDDAVIAQGTYGADDPAPVRDRLFDVLMRRFEAMAPDRTAYRSILRAVALDPRAAPALLCRLGRAMALMLEAAGLSAAGPCGVVRVKGLAAVYLSVLPVFFKDDGADLAKTMAALDKGLRRAGRVMEWLAGLPLPKPGNRRPAA